METLSVVIPVFNEGHNIAPMYGALKTLRSRLPGYTHEVLFVDDGSTDNTWEAVVVLAQSDPAVKGIRFSRNFGKEAALEAGLKEVKGDAVIVLDGDLQHPPECILDMVGAWKAGSDIVYARHAATYHAGITRRLTSFLFYRLFNFISNTPLQPGASDFCLLSRRVVDEIARLSEKQKFHRVLIPWVGFPSTSVSYETPRRKSGASAYTLRKLFSLARHAIVSSSTFPMTVIFLLGCLLTAFGGAVTIGLLWYKYFVNYEFIGAASVLGAFVIFNNGLLLIALGVVSLYVVAAYREVQNRPSYIVRDTL